MQLFSGGRKLCIRDAGLFKRNAKRVSKMTANTYFQFTVAPHASIAAVGNELTRLGAEVLRLIENQGVVRVPNENITAVQTFFDRRQARFEEPLFAGPVFQLTHRTNPRPKILGF
jgi:hypothetical protein